MNHTSPISARRYESLHPNALKLGRFWAIVMAFVIGGGISIPVGVFLSQEQGMGIGLILALATLLIVFLAVWFWLSATYGYRYAGFHLGDDGLAIRKGIFWRSETFVLRSRVQHTDVKRGPLERHFGMATLVVHTAGTKLSPITQSGLPVERAQAIRDSLISDADDAL